MLVKTYLLLGIALPLAASITTYSDRTAFNETAGLLRLIDFNSGPFTSVPIGGVFDLDFSGCCFENVIQYVNNTDPHPDLFLYAYPLTSIRVDLPSGTFAVGVDLTVYYLIPGTFTVTLSTGEVFQFPRPSFVPGLTPPPTFFGVVSTTPLTWMTVSYDNTYFIIDNFALTASAGAVPSCPLPACFAPTITAVNANPSILWPPNSKMIPIVVHALTSGGCGSVSCKIVSVSSNEPVDGGWVITGDLSLNLKAAREGQSDGRIYTITVQCTDAANNSTAKTGTVVVPHDLGN
ncbi:MAG TPA: hypothetical protein VH593_01010 [Ktedonobacteraceae bacterium]